MSAAPDLTTSTVTTTAEFANLADDWDVLVRAMGRPSPYLLHGWLLAWCRHYTVDGDLRVHLVRRGGRLLGALPFFVTRRGGVRVAQFLGGRHSALADLLLAPGAGDGVSASLIELALASDHDFADLFGLPGTGRWLDQRKPPACVSTSVSIRPCSIWVRASTPSTTHTRRRNAEARTGAD